MMLCYCMSMIFVVEGWVCNCGMIILERNYYRWVMACFIYYQEGTINIMLFFHWRVMIWIHYDVVVNQRGKLQSEHGEFVTCPESEQGGFGVWAGWTWFLSEPINEDIVLHAYESSWSCESNFMIKGWICDCCVCCWIGYDIYVDNYHWLYRCLNSTLQFMPLIYWCEFSPLYYCVMVCAHFIVQISR